MTSDVEHDEESASHSPDDSGDQDMADTELHDRIDVSEQVENATKTTKVNLKDPLRPRRKKARRACFACQRAHLTCGDERPCQRCIKRGLQDACQDGVRKKAKYLHDAPTEALLPGVSAQYQFLRNSQRQSQLQQSPESPTYGINQSRNEIYGPRPSSSSIPVYSSVSMSSQLPLTDTLINDTDYGTHHLPLTTQFQNPPSLSTSIRNLISTGPDGSNIQGFGGNIFDSSDSSQYNFDPASFNFGNHYGALEFGILGHMATGVGQTPPSDRGNSLSMIDGMMSNPGSMSSAYIDSPMGTGYLFGQDPTVGDWRTPTQSQSNIRTRPMTTFNSNGLKHEQPNAFSIGTNSSLTSPTSEMSPAASKITEDMTSRMLYRQNSTPNSRPGTRHSKQTMNPHQQIQQNIASAFVPTSRRRGDPSQVYRTITQPYSYTTGFHSLTAFLQKRFSSQQTLCIAKSLASIRPSFLACTKSLGREDLIFMEKCFQRTLWEYEDFINAIGTPTIVCRRTGEVAAVGKEFSILTGWKKDVLLGREANLNVNRGTSTSNINTSTTSTSTPNRGNATPKLPEGVLGPSNHLQPVFLAELLDDDSVIEFYEDFARLAFGDSHGTITTRCKLLKYRTIESKLPPLPHSSTASSAAAAAAAAAGPTALYHTTEDPTGKSSSKRKRPSDGSHINTNTGGYRREDIAGGPVARIDDLGDKDGKVDCSFCWTVKRDLFDLPMLIVMNFLPCI